jgi:hypothetical protein
MQPEVAAAVEESEGASGAPSAEKGAPAGQRP